MMTLDDDEDYGDNFWLIIGHQGLIYSWLDLWYWPLRLARRWWWPWWLWWWWWTGWGWLWSIGSAYGIHTGLAYISRSHRKGHVQNTSNWASPIHNSRSAMLGISSCMFTISWFGRSPTCRIHQIDRLLFTVYHLPQSKVNMNGKTLGCLNRLKSNSPYCAISFGT